MNLARAECISPRQSGRTDVGHISPKPRLRLVPPLDDGLQQSTNRKSVRVKIWFDAHSPLRQFWYGKRGRKWNAADQATGGMKLDYYRSHGKTTPVCGMLDPVQFVSDTIKKMEEACKESENADGRYTATLEQKLDQIWTQAMTVLAHKIGSDLEITFATAHGNNEVEHQMGVIIPFPHHKHVEDGDHTGQDTHHEEHTEGRNGNVVHLMHSDNHHEEDQHHVHGEHGSHHTQGEHEGLFEADAAMHPGHTKLIGGFWGSGHGHSHNEGSHGDQHTEQNHHGEKHEGHDHRTHDETGHGDRHHEGHHGEHHSHEHHIHGLNHEDHPGNNTHGDHTAHEHEDLFEADAAMHPGHTKLIGGFWGSGHGHTHHEHGDNSITGHSHQDHAHEGQHGDHRTTRHERLHLVDNHKVDHPLHEGLMEVHQGHEDRSIVNESVAHVLTNHERRAVQLKVANASAEPE